MELRRRDLDPDPLGQFERWYADAAAVTTMPERTALATADEQGAPSLRMVLLKGFDERGLVFFTHYTSRKGRELTVNPQAALLLYWNELGRQVRVEGDVERAGPEESDAYFATRPPIARAGAIASRQSEVLPDRATLDARVAEAQEDRLHDRFRYRLDGSGWIIERLFP
jgi:pyridoxamine 5'-phosphate oxidase